MKRIVLFCLLVSVFASAEDPTRSEAAQATIEVVTLQQVDPTATVDSLRHLDFRNLHFHIFDEHGKSVLFVNQRNGKSESKWTAQNGSDWLRLDWVRFFGEESEFAVTSLSWVTTGGSASDYGLVQVFTLRDRHPIVIQQLLFNMRGCGTSSRLSIHPLLLTIKGVHGWEHCCPKSLDVMTFNWVNGSFHRKAYRSMPLPESC